MTDRKFHKTIIKVEVLSEEPIPEGMDLQNVIAECTEGGWSMRQFGWKETELNGKQAAKALLLQGSDPGFFQLDEKGNDAE
jgi:hypothetical protein